MSDRTSLPSPESLLEHREWMRAIARGLVGDENVVDDVEQRSWMTVMRNRRPVESVRGWLRSVVKSSAADERRSDARRHVREEHAARPEAMPPTDHLVAEAEAQRAVAAAVTSLPEPYRGTVLLRYFEGLTPTEIAAKSGVPVDTVKTRLKRGLAMLREALDRDFGDRRKWTLVLLPLADWRAPTGAGVAAATVGGVVMGIKMQVAAAAVLVAALVTTVVWTSSSDGEPAVGAVAPATETPGAAPIAQKKRTREVPVGPTFALVGRVRSRLDGGPLAGARVSAAGAAAGGDSATDGTFRVEGANAGPVVVTAASFRAATFDVVAPPNGAAESALGDVWLDAASSLVVEVVGPGGTPIAGAEVRVVRLRPSSEGVTTDSYLWSSVDPDRGTATVGTAATGTDGVARFEALAPGPHQVHAKAKGYADASSYASIAPGADTARASLRLATAYRLTGRVVTDSGAPAPGRFVRATRSGMYGTRFEQCDAEGRFAIEGVAAGDVDLSAGLTRGSSPKIVTVRVPDVSEIELRLPTMGSITGTVTLADGTPVDGADVGVETTGGHPRTASAVVLSDANGRYRIDEIPAWTITRFVVRHAGLYHVGPRLEAGVFHDRRSGADAGVATVVPARDELRIDATMAKGARLHGRVTGPDGAVGGASVYLHMKATKAGQEWESAVADADGRYSFDFLPPGPCGAVPSHPAYVHADAPTTDLGMALASGKLAESLRFELPEGGDVERDFVMVVAPRVSGRVLGPDGAPLAGAVVSCEAARYGSANAPLPSAMTDAAGAFNLARVAFVGKAFVRADSPGLAQSSVPEVDLSPAAAVNDIEVRMIVSPPVTGRVLDGDGAAVPGAKVTLQMLSSGPAAGSRPVTVWTDAAGAFSAGAPRAGQFLVTATLDGRDPATAKIDVTSSGAAVDLRLAATVPVTGRVLRTDGTPVPGAAVLAVDTSDPKKPVMWVLGDLMVWQGHDTIRASTDAEGRFRMTLAPGPRKFIVRAPGLVEDVADATIPSPGGVEIRLRPATTLAGTVTGEDGKPLAGAVVLLDPSGDVASERISTEVRGRTPLDAGEHLLSHRTNAAGAFAFPGVPDGTYSLVVALPAPATPMKYREVRFGPLRPSGSPHTLSMSAPLASVLSGRIVGVGGVQYAEAKVRLVLIAERPWRQGSPYPSSKMESAAGGLDGSFRFEGLTDVSYTLQVTAGQDWSIFHGLKPSATEVVLEMKPPLRSAGRLVDDEGVPLARWRVEAEPANGDPCVSRVGLTTRADGTFDMERLEDIEYRVLVQTTGGINRRVTTPRLVRGGAGWGDFTATLEGRIRGVVVDKSGAIVAGAEVNWYPESGGRVLATTSAADGTFEATGVEPGVRLRIYAKSADARTFGGGDQAQVLVAGATDVRLVRE